MNYIVYKYKHIQKNNLINQMMQVRKPFINLLLLKNNKKNKLKVKKMNNLFLNFHFNKLIKIMLVLYQKEKFLNFYALIKIYKLFLIQM